MGAMATVMTAQESEDVVYLTALRANPKSLPQEMFQLPVQPFRKEELKQAQCRDPEVSAIYNAIQKPV